MPQSFHTVTNKVTPAVKKKKKKGPLCLIFQHCKVRIQPSQPPHKHTFSLTDTPNSQSYRQNPFEGYSEVNGCRIRPTENTGWFTFLLHCL